VHILLWSITKHGPPQAILVCDWPIFLNLLLWNRLAKLTVSVHLARRFQRRRFFRYCPIRNKNCLWWPCLLIDRDEMSSLHRNSPFGTPALMKNAERYECKWYPVIDLFDTFTGKLGHGNHTNKTKKMFPFLFFFC
jgi:hypothetical protein